MLLMAVVVMVPIESVLRILSRADEYRPPDPGIAGLLPKLAKQQTPIISGHSQIGLEPAEWIELISWCRMVSLHEDADLITGAVAIASALDE